MSGTLLPAIQGIDEIRALTLLATLLKHLFAHSAEVNISTDKGHSAGAKWPL